MNLSGRSVIAGVGESEQVRRPTRSVPHMCIEAALLALEDAGLTPRDVDAIITDDEMAPSVMVGSEMAAALDIERTFMIQATSGGAGYAYAPLLAAMALSMATVPVLMRFAQPLGQWLESKFPNVLRMRPRLESQPRGTVDLTDHAIVCGYGPVGEALV